MLISENNSDDVPFMPWEALIFSDTLAATWGYTQMQENLMPLIFDK